MTTAAENDIIARLERLPLGPFHLRMRLVVGVATFFDLFDAIMIAFVLPALIGAWKLSPPEIGTNLLWNAPLFRAAEFGVQLVIVKSA